MMAALVIFGDICSCAVIMVLAARDYGVGGADGVDGAGDEHAGDQQPQREGRVGLGPFQVGDERLEVRRIL